jgi:ectoine hydroxylase-related dioxygenase (phytanoyl-CoA dioxygenase family)
VLPLSDEQVDSFFEDGFLVVPDVFSPAEIGQMRSAFERLRQVAARLGRSGPHRGAEFVLRRRHGRPVRIERIVWCGAAEDVLSRFGCDPRLVAMSAQLLGAEEMRQLINQAHFELPGDGVEFPWHRDNARRRFGPRVWRDVNGRGSYVETVTAIDDVTAENGALSFIPGSNRQGHLAHGARGPGRLPAETADASRAVTPTIGAGGVLLFGPYTIHGGEANRSSHERRVFVNGFACPGANSWVYPGVAAGRLVRAPRRPPSLTTASRPSRNWMSPNGVRSRARQRKS